MTDDQRLITALARIEELVAERDRLLEPDPLLEAQGLLIQMQAGEIDRVKAERDSASANFETMVAALNRHEDARTRLKADNDRLYREVERLEHGLAHGAFWLRRLAANTLLSRSLVNELATMAIQLEACIDGEDIAGDEQLAT